jgi:hypothetical protein
MPYAMPPNSIPQAEYNLRMQEQFAATRRRPAPVLSADERVDRLRRIADLRDAGVLTDREFEIEKAKVLAGAGAP